MLQVSPQEEQFSSSENADGASEYLAIDRRRLALKEFDCSLEPGTLK